MPDSRYNGYTQNGHSQTNGEPLRRGQQNGPVRANPNNNIAGQENRSVNRPAGNAPQRPAGQGTARPANRPAGSVPQRPVQGSRAAGQGAARPANRPAGSAPQRPAQGRRPVGQGTAHPANRPAGSASQRPVQGSRPAGQGAARPVNRPSGSAPRRPVQGGRRPAQNHAPQNNGGNVPPIVQTLCAVLSLVLLITVCIGVTKVIRSRIPQPTIAVTTQQPDSSELNTVVSNETPVPTDVPATTNVPQTPVDNGLRRATIRAIGDVIIDEQMLENGEIGNEVYDFSPLFELAHGVMSDADWTMINIDASLRRGVYGYSGYPTICTPPSILDVLKDCGVDMLTMCNNHALDRYFDGLKESLDLVDAAGLAHVGAYRTQEEFDTPEVYDINGIKVGMLNYTQYTNGMASKSDKEATIYGMRLMQGADYAGDIADLKGAGAEFVIAIMHWGKEYIRYPEEDIEAVAKRLVAAGADLIIGGHPHVVQPAEYITATDAQGNTRTALCIYSIGNYLSEHRTNYTDNGVIFEFTLQEDETGKIVLVDPNCIPVYMWQIDLGGGKYDYRVVPTGEYLNNPPSGMSDSQYERMKQSWNELVELFAGVLPVNAN